MSETPQYQPGDIVNGYQLTPENEWVPAPQGIQPQGDHRQQPEPAKTPPPAQKSHRSRNIVLITAGTVVSLVIAASAIGAAATKDPTKQHAASVGTEQSSTPPAPATTQENTDTPTAPTDEDTSTDTSEPAGYALGSSVDVSWDDGEARVVVLKVREVTIPYSDPDHARYVEAFVRYHVLKGSLDVDFLDWAALARSHHAYDATIGGVDNELDSTTVRKGAFVEGWVVFDVGKSPIIQIQYAPNYGDDILCYWTVKV